MNMMKSCILVISFALTIIIANISSAQHNPDWLTRCGDTTKNVNVISGFGKDAGGNVYVSTNEGFNIRIFKLNSSGVIQWSRTIIRSLQCSSNDLVVDNSGNIVVTGFAENMTGTFDVFTVKYNPNGDSLWTRIYNGLVPSASDEGTAMTVDASNNIYVTGETMVGSSTDMLIIKYAPNGDSLWTRKFDNVGSDAGRAIVLDAQNNIFVYASVQVGSSATAYAVKYDQFGSFQWVLSNSMSPTYSKKAIALDRQGGIYITGDFSNGANSRDVRFIRINSTGGLVWTRSYNALDTNRVDQPNGLTSDSQGNLLAVTTSHLGGQYLISTIKYNAAGTRLWDSKRTINSTGTPSDIVCDEAGNTSITGFNVTPFVLQYSPAGDTTWSANYQPPLVGGNNFQRIFLGSANTFFVAGKERVAVSSSIHNVIVLKFSDLPTGLVSNNNIPSKISLDQNYPNPFNPTTNIIFNILVPAQVKLSVYNVLGEKISELINGRLSAGKHSIQFDASGLPSGVYYYKLDTEGHSQTRKMILIK